MVITATPGGGGTGLYVEVWLVLYQFTLLNAEGKLDLECVVLTVLRYRRYYNGTENCNSTKIEYCTPLHDEDR